MRIAVLDLSTPLPGSEVGPRAGALICGWLSPSLAEAELAVIDVACGAALPEAGAYDGFVLSGSEQGVYDTPAWMGPLRGFLLAARDAGRPLVGICFGHQIMADTFGGRAEHAGQGMVVGARRFTLDGQERDVHVWHQDQVTRVPPGATVTAAAGYCPVGALDYPFPAFSVQFHPEFSAPYMRREIRAVAGGSLAPGLAAAALDSIAGAQVAPDLAAAKAAATLRRAR